jgi:predicted extracellular nuclease
VRRARLLAAVLALATLVGAVGASQPLAVSQNIVVSQVYGGGGNSGATYTHDFVELFNRGSTSVNLAGWSVQYASATGTGNFGANSGQLTELPNVSLAPGQYLLVQEASTAAVGSPLPTPDVTDATPIAMSGTAGKVALANTAVSLGCNGGSTPCSAAQLAQVVDLVGYGNANFFEGAAAAPTLSNTTAALRSSNGCAETDNNASDFAAGGPTPRNTASPLSPCAGDAAPSVSSTSPANGATEVAVNANVSITFSEAVNVAGSWFDIACTSSGAHTATVSGGPTSFTLDPSTDFAAAESCTVTVSAAQVSDQDTDDPPDNMAANHVFGFTTVLGVTPIHDIQGSAHRSSLTGTTVKTLGIVTARASNGYYVQDASPDASEATSEGIFVFTGSIPPVAVGDSIQVVGNVTEFRPGGSGGTANLSTTELTVPSTSVLSSGNPLPTPTVIGTGGRVPPSQVIDDDAAGSVETSGSFDPATDGIDFYESLEGMRVQVNGAVAVGPTNDFGEIAVIGDGGANASVRTPRGGIIVRVGDFNPERVILDDVLAATPDVNTGDTFASPIVGVLDYGFGNFKLLVTTSPVATSGGLARETAATPGVGELTIATFNVENLHPGDPPAKFAALAGIIVNNLGAPDLVSLEEVQDESGPTDNGVVDATDTFTALIAAIQAAGGPTYEFRQIDPQNNADGGQPGGNIRVGFLFRTDRGLDFVDRPGGDATTATTIVDNAGTPELSISPGRVDPTNPAWSTPEGVRKPLVGEFRYDGRPLFVIANHWKSKGGDDPLFGRFQPPTLVTEAQRVQEAQVVNGFVDAILAVDPDAAVVVMGDLNDFDFSSPLTTLEGGVLTNLYDTLPQGERYSYVFDGNSQALDHVLVSSGLAGDVTRFDAVHVNAEFATQSSDHDPLVAEICADASPPSLTVSVSPSVLWPPNHKYRDVTATVTVSDSVDPSPSVVLVSATSNEPDNAPGGADGNTVNDVLRVDDTHFRLRAERNENGAGRTYTITYRATDACGNSTTRSATVSVPISR